MKPRLAESPGGLWEAIRTASKTGVVGPAGRIIYPTLRCDGKDYQVACDGVSIQRRGTGGALTLTAATPAEVTDLHQVIDNDQLQVLLLSQPGFQSGYRRPYVLQELHSPSGAFTTV